MKWNHIMDCQPEDGRSIIQIDPPYEGHYSMGMRKYDQKCSFEDVLKFYRKMDTHPNFWWVYKEDFPFPEEVK